MNCGWSYTGCLNSPIKETSMRIHKIAAIPADGIGPEVIAAGLEVLNALASDDGGFKFDIEHFPWSSDYYLEHGYYIPEGGLEKLKTFDAIFFGAVGSQQVPDHVSLWGLRLPIAQGFDQYDGQAQAPQRDMDYISRYETAQASTLVDRIEQIV
eukprot:gene35338-39976_t